MHIKQPSKVNDAKEPGWTNMHAEVCIDVLKLTVGTWVQIPSTLYRRLAERTNQINRVV